ncbi:MAG TPA: hypothetical protein VF582_01085 [Allosphingosinicella sp.]
MRILAIAALLLPLTSVPVPAAAQKSEPDKLVCKSEPRLASRMMTRTCKSAAEWEAIAEKAKRNMAEIAGQPQINPVACGGSRPC